MSFIGIKSRWLGAGVKNTAVKMYSTSPAPQISVEERRPLCARIVAFIIMLFTTTFMVAMVLSVAIYLVASPDTIEKILGSAMGSLAGDEAGSGLAQQPASEQPANDQPASEPPTRADCIEHVEPVAGDIGKLGSEYEPEFKDNHLKQDPTRDIYQYTPLDAPRQTTRARIITALTSQLVRRIFAVLGVLCVIAAAAAIAYFVVRAYASNDALSQLISTKDTVLNAVSQFFYEVLAGSKAIIEKVVTFDFAGLWQQGVDFGRQVWAELLSYVHKKKAEVFHEESGEALQQ